MPYPVCTTSEIDDPGSKGFEIDTGFARYDVFVVHKDGQFHSYINSCPHTGANLEWQEHQFLDMDNAFIQCSTHDALFEIDTGHCVAGPCVGDRLRRVEVEIRQGTIYVELG